MSSQIPELQLVSADVQWGQSGPRLKANSGALEARNAADSDYTYLRCKAPAAGNDAVNLTYLQANYYTKTAADAAYIPIIATPTQYRIPFVAADGKLTESSSIVTDSGGNLGVGGAPGSYKLDVTLPLNGFANFETSTSGYGGIRIADGNQPLIQFNSGANQQQIYGGVGLTIRNYTATGYIDLLTNSTRAIRINSSQQVLINGTSPIGSEKLYVGGAGHLTGNLTVLGNNIYTADYVVLAPNTTNANGDIRIQGNGTGYGQLRVYDQDNAELLQLYCQSGDGNIQLSGTSPTTMNFITGGSAPIVIKPGGSEAIRFNSSGKVLITSLKTAQSHPTNYKQVYVDTDSGELYRIA